ncbi:MAG: putative hydro-lyase [Proteobacteria bacterium]|nr:putative hydro-lyase [Pseudomonadota bacterium]
MAIMTDDDLLLTGRDVRLACRANRWSASTAGLAPGCTQANLVVLPADVAGEFMLFCQRNPKPCPVLAVTAPGEVGLPQLGADIDLRTDLPGYRVWQHGALVAEPDDLAAYWRDDLVAFVIGCSYTFETALRNAGIGLRHVEQGTEVPMYRTAIDCVPAGRFHGRLVVSMRPLKPRDAIRAVQITSRYPAVHGAPVHIGLPGSIGIEDLDRPDYGMKAAIRPDELPVFWACGVTPQSVLAASRLPFAITHRPGRMLVLDVADEQYAIM